MSKKTLLEEATVRRFMKLAEMEPLASNFVNENYPPMADDDDPTPEEAAYDTAYETEGEEEGFEAGEEATEDELGDDLDVDLDMDDEPIGDEEVATPGELILTDEEAEVFLKVADKVRAAVEAEPPAEELPVPDMGDEEVADLDLDDGDVDVEEEEEEVELAEGSEEELEEDKPYTAKKEKPGADLRRGAEKRGAEGTKKKTSGKRRGTKAGDDAYVNEDLVNEIAARVAERVLQAQKK